MSDPRERMLVILELPPEYQVDRAIAMICELETDNYNLTNERNELLDRVRYLERGLEALNAQLASVAHERAQENGLRN